MKHWMAPIFIVLFIGCGSMPESSSAFIEWNDVIATSDSENMVSLSVPIGDSEHTQIKLGTSYTSGSKSGRSHAEVSIRRDGNSIAVVTTGQGGEPLVWQQSEGESLISTKTITRMENPITYTYVITLADIKQESTQGASTVNNR